MALLTKDQSHDVQHLRVVRVLVHHGIGCVPRLYPVFLPDEVPADRQPVLEDHRLILCVLLVVLNRLYSVFSRSNTFAASLRSKKSTPCFCFISMMTVLGTCAYRHMSFFIPCLVRSSSTARAWARSRCWSTSCSCVMFTRLSWLLNSNHVLSPVSGLWSRRSVAMKRRGEPKPSPNQG